MLKFAKSIFWAACLSAFALTAYAGGAAIDAVVTHVRIDKSGKRYVIFDRVFTGTIATCSDPVYNRHLAFDAGTAAGRAILATALAAKTSGALVSAYGTGACANYVTQPNRVEGWNYGHLK